ncbi:MAG TPA: hypothetical protein VF171_02890, partial [Trueperaceae bacterium]
MIRFVVVLLLAFTPSALAQSNETYLSQNASKPEDTGGQARLMHYLPEDMPIQVFVPRPAVPDGAALQEA